MLKTALRFTIFIGLIYLLASCSRVVNYTYQIPQPIPPGSTLLLVDEGSPSGFTTRFSGQLIEAGFGVVGRHEWFRRPNSARTQVVASDSSYVEEFTQPIVDRLYDQAPYQYVIRYQVNPISYGGGGFNRISVEISQVSTGLTIGTFHHLGVQLENQVSKTINELVIALRDGRVENWTNRDAIYPKRQNN